MLLLFIFAPFLAFVRSVTRLNKSSARWVFVLFFALFGYCHTFTDIRADSYRKQLSFNAYTPESINKIAGKFSRGEQKDIYESLLFSSVKQLSNNPRVMMMMVGLVGGWLYMLVVRRFLEDCARPLSTPILILIAMLVIESNIAVMGGIRNFTAFPLFLYSLIRLVIDKRWWWIIGLIITPLIHFGWVVASIVAIIAWLVPLRKRVLHYVAIVVCAASLFLDTSSYGSALSIVTSRLDNESITTRLESYSDEDVDQEFNRSLTTRLVRLNNKIGTCFVILLLVYLRSRRRRLISDSYVERIYRLLLWFTILGYAFMAFSVVGQRYVYVAIALIYILLANIWQRSRDRGIGRFIYALPLLFCIHILWTLYNCYCNTGWEIFALPLPVIVQ